MTFILLLSVARRFAQLLRRQTSLNHLCQASRTVIHSADITSQMLEDWVNVDLSSITKQTLYTMDKYSEGDYETIVSCKWCFIKLFFSKYYCLAVIKFKFCNQVMTRKLSKNLKNARSPWRSKLRLCINSPN